MCPKPERWPRRFSVRGSRIEPAGDTLELARYFLRVQGALADRPRVLDPAEYAPARDPGVIEPGAQMRHRFGSQVARLLTVHLRHAYEGRAVTGGIQRQVLDGQGDEFRAPSHRGVSDGEQGLGTQVAGEGVRPECGKGVLDMLPAQGLLRLAGWPPARELPVGAFDVGGAGGVGEFGERVSVSVATARAGRVAVGVLIASMNAATTAGDAGRARYWRSAQNVVNTFQSDRRARCVLAGALRAYGLRRSSGESASNRRGISADVKAALCGSQSPVAGEVAIGFSADSMAWRPAGGR